MRKPFTQKLLHSRKIDQSLEKIIAPHSKIDQLHQKIVEHRLKITEPHDKIIHDHKNQVENRKSKIKGQDIMIEQDLPVLRSSPGEREKKPKTLLEDKSV